MVTARFDDPRILELPGVARRFLRYVRIDTQSDPVSTTVPSTSRQKDLGHVLAAELEAMGIEATMDEFGYVFATIPASGDDAPKVALLAHLDTSPDEPGAANPLVHFGYDGSIITLPGNRSVRLDPSESRDLLDANRSVRLDPLVSRELLDHIGEDLITGDGTSLLGSDDKAGVAVLMQLAEDLTADPGTPRPELRLCFTIDEEIGRGVDHLDLNRLDADVAYTIDGGGTRTIYAETFNAAEAIVEIRGVMVHPGYAKGIMVNAVRILGELLAQLPSGEAPETTEDREGYIHPHLIYPSDATLARAKILLRDFTDDGLARRKELLESLAAMLRVKHPRAEIDLAITDQYRNMRSYIEEKDARA
ncbi:MAG: tripeptide aminopeptidase PepT, partial [Rhodothermales bacterium]